MSKIIEAIQETYQSLPAKSTSLSASASFRPTISFEYFPAKTEDGIFNLLNRIEEMDFNLKPTFVTLTWRSAFKNGDLWLRIGAHIQNNFGLNVLMHLTCHLPRDQIKDILDQARSMGIRNILALRGDPPIGSEAWKPRIDGFNNAVDLIYFIRELYGDYFCVACAGYPEAHIECWNHPDTLPPSKNVLALDIKRLKMKQDAGADFIITQFFFDVDNLLHWIKECRREGIHIPILPGYLPIQNYASFLKFTQWCKTRVPPEITEALQPIHNDDDAVKRYGTELAIRTCRKIIDAGIASLHFYTMNLSLTVTKILQGLELVPAPHQRDWPWHTTLSRRHAQPVDDCETAENGTSKEMIRPIFWSNRQASYIARTAGWDDYPNGRWGDRASPAYGELSEYYLAYKRPKLNRKEIWGVPSTEADVWNVFVRYLTGEIKQLPWCEHSLVKESLLIKEKLKWINENGFLTINSQPRVNGAPSTDLSVGWGGPDGYVFQKAYVEFFCSPGSMEKLINKITSFPTLSFHALNVRGDEFTNKAAHSVTAVTWGVFPSREILQPTIVDTDSFKAWKDEAFELWLTQWASVYEKGSRARSVIQSMHDTHFLVNIVDHDYTNDDSDIFRVFTHLILDDMTEEKLHEQVVHLHNENEKLHGSISQLSSLYDKSLSDLKASQNEITCLRQRNNELENKLRHVQAQACIPHP